MATQKYNTKMNLNLTGSSFTDESHTNLGASAFTLDHDWFINDTTSGDVLVIRTAAAGGGTLLVENTDYTISNQDTVLSDADHVNKDVYSDITIINAAYQATTLYFSGKYVGDSIDHTDISQLTAQYTAVSASATLAPTSYTVYACTAGTNGIKLTLPAASEYNKNLILDFVKVDSTDSAAMIDGNGAETINGLASIYLIEQWQRIRIIGTGTGWTIISGTLIANSGWINTNDETNRHFGTVDVDYDNLVGAFQIGETVTESGGETGIIMKDTGTTLTLWKVTDSGVFTNNNTLAGNLSGATADVDEAGTGSTKNLDSDFYHGFGVSCNMLTVLLQYSTTPSEATSFDLGPFVWPAAANYYGTVVNGVDTNNFRVQTGSAGVTGLSDAGAVQTIGAVDAYYRVVCKLII